MVARQAHNLKVVGSNPASATKNIKSTKNKSPMQRKSKTASFVSQFRANLLKESKDSKNFEAAFKKALPDHYKAKNDKSDTDNYCPAKKLFNLLENNFLGGTPKEKQNILLVLSNPTLTQLNKIELLTQDSHKALLAWVSRLTYFQLHYCIKIFSNKKDPSLRDELEAFLLQNQDLEKLPDELTGTFSLFSNYDPLHQYLEAYKRDKKDTWQKIITQEELISQNEVHF